MCGAVQRDHYVYSLRWVGVEISSAEPRASELAGTCDPFGRLAAAETSSTSASPWSSVYSPSTRADGEIRSAEHRVSELARPCGPFGQLAAAEISCN